MRNNLSYTGENIELLRGLQAVRERPSVYIGGTDKKALHHLVYELLDNSLDEASEGYGNKITVVLHKNDEISVIDEGRGIPCDVHPTENIPTIDVVFTKLHAGGKFSKSGYRNASSLCGLNGLGVKVVCALTEKLYVEVHRDDRVYIRNYSKGQILDDSNIVESKEQKSKNTGTIVRIKPDIEIFKRGVKFDQDVILSRLNELSYLCPNLELIFKNEKDNKTQTFISKNGLIDYIKYLSDGKDGIFPDKPIHFSGNSNSTQCEVVIQYCQELTETGYSFCNNIPTIDQGTHISGFKKAFTRALNAFGRENNLISEKEDNLLGDDLRDGMMFIISVKVKDPIFDSQTKSKLTNPEVETAVGEVIYKQTFEYFASNLTTAKRIIDAAIASRRIRLAAKKQASLARKKSIFGKTILPGKLTDCDSSDPKKCELFLVEGDSAAGPVKDARNSSFQAVLPFKGKSLNVEKKSLTKVLENEEIQGLIAACGCGIIDFGSSEDDGFDLSKLRYNKITILSDADPDGKHIQCLLMTFFLRYMRPLIENGYLYIADPPLFLVKGNKEQKFCYTEYEMEETRKKYKDKCQVERFKGLGSMEVDQLSETAIDPTTRRIYKVEIEHLGETDKIVRSLMGKDGTDRKELITSTGE